MKTMAEAGELFGGDYTGSPVCKGVREIEGIKTEARYFRVNRENRLIRENRFDRFYRFYRSPASSPLR